MAHKGTAEEEALVGEGLVVLKPEMVMERLPLIEAKIVYLGGHPKKTVHCRGHISTEQVMAVSIADLVTEMFQERKGPDGTPVKWAQLHREEQQKVRDELTKREAQSPTEFVKKQVMEGAQNYDFSTVNNFGKPLPKSLLTKDGRRFQMVEHFAHIVELFRMKEPDGAPMFRVEALPAAMRIIQEYIRSTKRQRDPESGIALLEQMEDKF